VPVFTCDGGILKRRSRSSESDSGAEYFWCDKSKLKSRSTKVGRAIQTQVGDSAFYLFIYLFIDNLLVMLAHETPGEPSTMIQLRAATV